MAAYSAGLLNVQNLTVPGASASITATNVTATTLNTTNMNATNFGFTNLDLSGNLVVRGTLTVPGTVTTGSLLSTKTDSSGNNLWKIDLSGNATFRGMISNPDLVALGVLQPNGQQSAQSVYTAINNQAGSGLYNPLTELQLPVNIGIFTDSSNTTVRSDFINNTRIGPTRGQIYYYASDGDLSGNPVDGTAGTPINTGVGTGIGTPIFVDVTDSSGYAYAIKKTYKNLPSLKDLSGNVGGATAHVMNYSGGCLSITKECATNAVVDGNNYYLTRGYIPSVPGYNSNEYNIFVQGLTNNQGFVTIEMVYGASVTVPSSIYLNTATTCRSGNIYQGTACLLFKAANYKMYTDLSGYGLRRPISVPVTTNRATFGLGVMNSQNIVFYDVVKKVMSINFATPDTDSQTMTYGGYNATISYTHILKSFVASFAVVKKGNLSYQTTGITPITANELIPCSPNNPLAMLQQVSPTITIVDNLVYSTPIISVSSASDTTQNYPLVSATTGEFVGWTVPRHEFGAIGTNIYFYYNGATLNSFVNGDVYPEVGSTDGSFMAYGDNVNTPIKEKFSAVNHIYEWDSEDWKPTGFYFPALEPITTTPETMVALDASNYQSMDSNPTVMDSFVLLHESMHSRDLGAGYMYALFNAEGHACSIELSAPRNDIIGWWLLRSTFFYSYFSSYYRGYCQLNRTYLPFINNIYTSQALGLNDNTLNQNLTPFLAAGRYGEAVFYRYMCEYMDPNNQVLRRQRDILVKLASWNIFDEGTKQSQYLLGLNINQQLANFAMDQAISEVSAGSLTLADVYSSYALAALFLRNNTGIPFKYRNAHPWWMFNRRNQFNDKMRLGNAKYVKNGRGPSYGGWSDLDETNIYTYENSGFVNASLTANSSGKEVSHLDGQTMIPFWPRDSSGEAQYKLGTLTRTSNQITAWTPNTTAWAPSKTVLLEDMATVSYILPTADVSGNVPSLNIWSQVQNTAGTNNSNIATGAILSVFSGTYPIGGTQMMTGLSIQVNRGHWSFAVAQYVPDISGVGSWTQLPSSGNFTLVDVSGVYVETSGGTCYTNPVAPQTITFDLTAYKVQYYNGIPYFPKLVCVNRGLYDYGKYLNMYPAKCRYSGEIVITPTFV